MQVIERFDVYLVTPAEPEGRFAYSTPWFNEEEFTKKCFPLDEYHILEFTAEGMEIYDEITDETVVKVVAVRVDKI